MNNPTFQIIEYRGCTIEIHHDPDPLNPREGGCEASTMACWHRKYNLGDEQPKESPEEYLHALAMAAATEEEKRWFERARYSNAASRSIKWSKWLDTATAKKVAKILDREYIRLPLWLYDHSGISMSTGERGWPYDCQWDSGQVGIIYISLAKAKETFLGAEELTRIEDKGWETLVPARGEDEPKKLIEHATECLYDEVKLYDDYLTGNAWSFTAYGIPAKGEETGEEITSSRNYLGDDGWNFQNEDSYMMTIAKAEIDAYLARLEAAEEAKKRNVSTLDELAAITPCPELAMALFHHIGFDDNSQLGELTRTLTDTYHDLEILWKADIPGFLNDEDASSFFTHNINRIMLLAIECSKEAGESLSSFMSKIPFGGAHGVHEIDRWLCSSIRRGSIGIKFGLLALREIANACRYAVLK